MRRRLNITLLMLVALVLAGCGGSTVAPVSERGVPSGRDHSHPKVAGNARGYQVKRGDTLYSIAFHYGRDYRELAALNHIAPPYTIYVGQRIRLTSAAAAPVAPKPAPPPPTKPAPSPKPATPSVSTPKPPPVITKRPPPPPATHVSSGPLRWRWPAKGKVLTRFDESSGGRRGIDIAGTAGDPVHAAADGVVVYSGSGLRGYGELIIVKHNNNYLSAYAHNRRLLAREGDNLKAGDVLAEMGRSETDRVMLHFEIRHDGKPVDPMRYLPNR